MPFLASNSTSPRHSAGEEGKQPLPSQPGVKDTQSISQVNPGYRAPTHQSRLPEKGLKRCVFVGELYLHLSLIPLSEEDLRGQPAPLVCLPRMECSRNYNVIIHLLCAPRKTPRLSGKPLRCVFFRESCLSGICCLEAIY